MIHVGAATIAVVALASPLPIAQTRLANGIEVVLAPDDAASSVVVHVRYEGGAAADTDACSGCAKLAEHLLRVSPELDARVDALGGWTSGEATINHVATTTHVPPGALAFAVWLEADRAERARHAGVEARVRAVASVDAEGNEQEPIARVARVVQRLLWDGDPYGNLVFGRALPPRDGDMRGYLARPIVVIAGRFDRARGETLVRRYFGELAAATAQPARAEPIQPREVARYLVKSDPIPKVVVAFRFAADAADVVAVAARILQQRFARALVATGRATEIRVELDRRARGGDVKLVAIAAPGVEPFDFGAAIEAELVRFREAPASADEVRGAATALDLELVLAFEGLAFRAAELARWTALYGRAHRFAAARGAPYDVSPADVHAAATTWFAHEIRIVGSP